MITDLYYLFYISFLFVWGGECFWNIEFIPISERATMLRHKVSSWDFSPFDFSHDDLIHCAYLILEQALVLPELAHLTINQGIKKHTLSFILNIWHKQSSFHFIFFWLKRERNFFWITYKKKEPSLFLFFLPSSSFHACTFLLLLLYYYYYYY